MINKLLWGKNYKIPFRSNIKVFQNKLFVSNQNNSLFIFDKLTGDILKTIPTEETVIKNKFINNLSLSTSSLYFLNTYGSLYSISLRNLQIEWFLNLNKSVDINPSNLFMSNQIVNFNNKLVVSSNQNLQIINSIDGSILSKKNFSSFTKPIIQNEYIFLITKNNYLVAVNLMNGNIIYSYNINKKISEFLNKEK